jgi:hypothetical protein
VKSSRTNSVLAVRRFVGTAAALGLLAVTLAALPSAGAARPGAAAPTAEFVGAWRLTVTGIPGVPAFPVAVAYHADGTLVATGLPLQPAAPGAANALVFNGTGVGTWEATGPGTSAFTFVVLNADEHGRYLGTLTVSGTQHLSADGATLTSDNVLTVADPAGKTGARFPTTSMGARIGVEPIGTPIATPGS